MPIILVKLKKIEIASILESNFHISHYFVLENHGYILVKNWYNGFRPCEVPSPTPQLWLLNNFSLNIVLLEPNDIVNQPVTLQFVSRRLPGIRILTTSMNSWESTTMVIAVLAKVPGWTYVVGPGAGEVHRTSVTGIAGSIVVGFTPKWHFMWAMDSSKLEPCFKWGPTQWLVSWLDMICVRPSSVTYSFCFDPCRRALLRVVFSSLYSAPCEINVCAYI